MKKSLKVFLALLMVIVMVTMSACSGGKSSAPQESSPAQEAAVGEWTLAVEGVDSVTAFTSGDAAALEVVTLEMTITNKNGESKTNSYTGVKLKDILAAIGVDSVTGVTVAATDDYSADYTQDLVMADDTILAWAKDGEPLSDNSLQMCPKAGTGNLFVKNVGKIIISK